MLEVFKPHKSVKRALSHYRGPLLILCSVLFAGTFLQKIAIPGTHGDLPLSVALVPLLALAGLLTRALELRTDAFVLLTALLLIGVADIVASNGNYVSLPSLALFAVTQSCLVFRLVPGVNVATALHHVLRAMISILAIFGILQFGLQFVLGSGVAFYIDQLPLGTIVRGFNVMNPLAWNSPIFKSNGVFLLEPSFFCQIMAIGIALEIIAWRSVVRFTLLGIATLVSFSGTGLTMLALFLPLFATSRRQYGVLAIALVTAAALFLAAGPLGLGGLTGRIGEFSDPQSSGWARFASPFMYLGDVIFQSPWTFLLGRGPGSIEQIQYLGYGAFDPTWAKLLYEYGFLGLTAYFALFYAAFVRSNMPLRFPLGYTYFLLGGYLLNTSVVGLIAALVVWPQADTFAPQSLFTWRKTFREPVNGRPFSLR